MKRRPLFDYDAAMAADPYKPLDSFDLPAPAGMDGLQTVLTLAVVALLPLYLVIRYPFTAVTVGGAGWLWWTGGWGRLLTVAGPVAVVLVVWRLLHRRSFTAVLGNRALSRWRTCWTYRLRWSSIMHGAGLTRVDPIPKPNGRRTRLTPRLIKVRSTKYSDRVFVRMLDGQAVEEFQNHTSGLASSFGARSCRVHLDENRRGRIWLEFIRHDALAATVTPAPITTTKTDAEEADGPGGVDLSRLTIGRREDGAPWVVPLAGSHLLIGGATNAGKSSIIWSLVHALAPAVSAGVVQVWACDPKRGAELSIGAGMFSRFAYGATAEDMVTMIEDVEQVIARRADVMRGITRRHVPTPVEPHLVVILDEIAALTAYQQNRDLLRRFERALAVVLSQGRAFGVSVVGAVQDPRKKVLDLRGLFPIRIALRLPEREDVALILSPGAHDRGAECERIPVGLPGVGYVETDDDPEPVRVRAAWLDDAAIRDMAARYAPPAALAAVPDVVPGEVVEDDGRAA